MTVMSKKVFFILILGAFSAISLALNIFLVFKIGEITTIRQENQVNTKVLAFRDMFSEKVLLASKDIDFDTRLELENSVRSLNDTEIFEQWKRFVDSETKEQATYEAKNLLSLLIVKTSQ